MKNAQSRKKTKFLYLEQAKNFYCPPLDRKHIFITQSPTTAHPWIKNIPLMKIKAWKVASTVLCNTFSQYSLQGRPLNPFFYPLTIREPPKLNWKVWILELCGKRELPNSPLCLLEHGDIGGEPPPMKDQRSEYSNESRTETGKSRLTSWNNGIASRISPWQLQRVNTSLSAYREHTRQKQGFFDDFERDSREIQTLTACTFFTVWSCRRG